MNIICWNVNGIRAWSKKGAFEWFLKESPDFFCLQETKAEEHQLDPAIRTPEGYTAYFDHSKGRKGYSGVAIYTKHAPTRVEYEVGVKTLDQEGRLLALIYDNLNLTGKADSTGTKVAIITSYFPNGGGGPVRLKYKLDFYKAFLIYIEKLKKAGYGIIFCGDVNTAHHEIDLARPKENETHTGFLPIERAWIDKIITAGYIDVFRHLYPTQTGAYTWWDMKTFARERNVGWRIDYFFISPDLEKAVSDMKIHSDIYGSDHCPIELRLK
jgi:exodeoxyribonuclease-3